MKSICLFARLLLLLGAVGPVYSQAPIATKVTDALLAENSKQYDEYSLGDTAEGQIAKRANYDAAHNVFVVVRHPNEEVHTGHAPLSDRLAELKARVANADAIVIGVPQKRYSALTSSHQFAFSDYEVAVDSLYLDRTGLLVPGMRIVLTRPGGEVNLDGEKFRAIEPEFPLFRLNSRYLFFLHRDPATGVFKLNFSDAYLIQGDQVVEARRQPKMLHGPKNLASFTSDIEAVVASESKRSR